MLLESGYQDVVIAQFEDDRTPFLHHFENGHFWVGLAVDKVLKTGK